MKTCPRELIPLFAIHLLLFCIFFSILLLRPAFALPETTLVKTQQDVQVAVELLKKQEYDQALDLLLRIQASIPDRGAVQPLLAIAYLGKGHQLLAAADYPAARKAFQEGRRYSEDDVRLWEGEALSWYRQGRYAEAVSLLDQALGIAPENSALYHLLGVSYYADGRMAEALDALERARELGGGEGIEQLLEKVRREWQVERDMSREVSGHFQVSFVDDEQAANLAPEILDSLEEAYAELGSELDFYPDVMVPVLLYSHKDFATVTNSPDWAGAAYDGKIRLPLGGMTEMSEPLVAVLYHEYVHVLVHFLTNGNAPVWLNEGLAEVAGRSRFSPPLRQMPRAVKADQLINWVPLAHSFAGLTGDQAQLAYEQSYSLVQYMVDNFGWHKITELLGRLGQRQEWQVAIADVYREYEMDWPAILNEWQAGLQD
jgi:tetratricopeptide (TPR) repeat protein